MPTSDDDATVATEDVIATGDTVAEGSPQPGTPTSRPIIRASRPRVALTRLGRYTITRPLGRGGMGSVFEADDPELGRRVAIKVLREDRNAEGFADRLKREAQALAKLVHPNVVSVYDVGADAGQVFIVMQLVDGVSIDRWLRARHARSAQIVAAFQQAGRGLAAAHAAGLVHRDFKPANVLVEQDGVVRVTDFGLARITAEHDDSIAGTPCYMAPEQFTGVATPKSDQYAFCVALYEVLAGAALFAEAKLDDPEAARKRVIPPMPRSARVAPRVTRALQRGLSVDPDARFPTMDALLVALAPPVRRRWIVATAIGAVAVGGGAVAVAARSTPPAAPGVADLTAVYALTHDGASACAYSPTVDDDRVIFDRTAGEADDLYDVPIGGGVPRQLTTAAPWEWRAHAGRRPGEVIHLVHDQRTLAGDNVSYFDLATRTDTVAFEISTSDAVSTSAGIVYVGVGGRELRRRDGSQDQTLVGAPIGTVLETLAVSNHRDHLATIPVTSGSRQVCVVDVAIAKLTCTADTLAIPTRPAYGVDDRFLYYAATDGIHSRDLASGVDTLVVADVRALGGLAVTGDGSALVYSECGSRARVLDWTTQPPTTVVDDATATAARGTNGSVVWVRARRGVTILKVRDRSGLDRELTDFTFGSISYPAISPDGTMVAFRSGPPHAGIYVAALRQSGAMALISNNPQDAQPVWIDNDRIAFSRTADHNSSTVYVAAVDGTNLHALPSTAMWAIGGRDGKVLVTSAMQWYWHDLDTGADTPGPDTEVQDMIAAITSPNGRWVVFRTGEQSQFVYRMSLDPPGQAERLAEIPTGDTLADASISDDGHVLVVEQTWAGDLVVVPAQAGTRF